MAGYGYGMSVSGSRTPLVSGEIPSPPSLLLNNLLAYWKLDNNGSGGVSLVDSSGNSRTLSAPNGTTDLSLGTGIINGSAQFINDDNSTYLSRSGTFLNGARSEYSISAWVKTTSIGYVFIVDQATGNNISGSSISLDMAPDGTILGTVYWGVPNEEENPYFDRATGTTSVNNGNWHHVAMTWNYDYTIKVYVDGEEDASEFSSGVAANVPTENISLNSNADGSFATGQSCNIDEVGVWSRELEASEITSLYNAGAGITYPF